MNCMVVRNNRSQQPQNQLNKAGPIWIFFSHELQLPTYQHNIHHSQTEIVMLCIHLDPFESIQLKLSQIIILVNFEQLVDIILCMYFQPIIKSSLREGFKKEKEK